MSAHPLFDLSGKVAVVTGGNGGIGLGIATGLAQAGARVAIVARDAGKGQAAVQAMTDEGGEAIFVQADVASREQCFAMANDVAERLGRIDILVANAGLARVGRSATVSEEDWRFVLDVNLSGVFFCAQAVYPHMVKAGGGKIVNIGSMAAVFGSTPGAAYGASKGGVTSLTRSLATGWARDNIQVNTIHPGWIVTDIIADAKAASAEFDAAITKRTPAARWGEPADLAGTAVFLCSKASDFVTGADIPVDGGYSVMI